MVKQCAILLGGLGTRLGELTREIPKPLLPVGGKPFVELLIREAWRMGFSNVLLLSGYKSERVEELILDMRRSLPEGCSIDISIEPEPLGTGGAVAHALPLLDEQFVLINGDTWFDFNWNQLVVNLDISQVAMGIREVPLPDRYETIIVGGGGIVTDVLKRGEHLDPPYFVNGGVYCFSRQHFLSHPYKFSLEADLLPVLATAGLLKAHVSSGYFLDIGVPETYARSQVEIPARRNRPAVLIASEILVDADNRTISAIAAANEAGYLVFGLGDGMEGQGGLRDAVRARGANIDGLLGGCELLSADTDGYSIDMTRVLVVSSSSGECQIHPAVQGKPVLSIQELGDLFADFRVAL